MRKNFLNIKNNVNSERERRNEIKFHYTNKPESNTRKNILRWLAGEPVWRSNADMKQSCSFITREIISANCCFIHEKKCTSTYAVCNFLAKKCWRLQQSFNSGKKQLRPSKTGFLFLHKKDFRLKYIRTWRWRLGTVQKFRHVWKWMEFSEISIFDHQCRTNHNKILLFYFRLLLSNQRCIFR